MPNHKRLSGKFTSNTDPQKVCTKDDTKLCLSQITQQVLSSLKELPGNSSTPGHLPDTTLNSDNVPPMNSQRKLLQFSSTQLSSSISEKHPIENTLLPGNVPVKLENGPENAFVLQKILPQTSSSACTGNIFPQQIILSSNTGLQMRNNCEAIPHKTLSNVTPGISLPQQIILPPNIPRSLQINNNGLQMTLNLVKVKPAPIGAANPTSSPFNNDSSQAPCNSKTTNGVDIVNSVTIIQPTTCILNNRAVNQPIITSVFNAANRSTPTSPPYDNTANLSRDSASQSKSSHLAKVKRYFVCPICDIETQVISTHMENHENQGDLKCKLCDSKINNCALWILKIHFTGRCKKLHTCKDCGRPFTQEALLRSHQLTYHENKPFQCLMCQASFEQQVELSSHWETLHLNRTNNNSKYILHKQDNSLYKHKCVFCNKTYKRTDFMVNHMRVHRGERPFKCVGSCGKVFVHRSVLMKHQQVCHEKQQEEKQSEQN